MAGHWIGKATKKKPGAFRAQARRAGYDDTFKYARAVLRNPSKHSDTTKKRARLALQLEKYQKRRKKNPAKKSAKRGGTTMARRRRSTRKYGRRRTARLAYTRRRGNPQMRLGNVGKVLAIAAGAVAAANVDFLKRQITEGGPLPVTWAAVLGGFLLLRGKGSLQKHIGIGMLLGGGVQTAVGSALGPALAGMGGGMLGGAQARNINVPANFGARGAA